MSYHNFVFETDIFILASNIKTKNHFCWWEMKKINEHIVSFSVYKGDSYKMLINTCFQNEVDF